MRKDPGMTSRRSWSGLLVLTLVLVIGCGPAGTGASSVPAPSSTERPPTAAASPAAAGRHVFVIVMENKTYAEALRGSYTASLARRYAVLTDYHAIAHPSLPNYLALTSGSTWNITDDGYHTLPKAGLGDQLSAHGVSWRAYMEGLSGNCLSNGSGYAVKHDPFAYYGGSCPSNVVSLSRLGPDLAGGGTPSLVWITPDLCHDTHDCPVGAGDRWLSTVVPEIASSRAWTQGGVLLITWDESEGGDPTNRVPTLVVSPDLKPATPGARYDHYSLLATVEDLLGVPRLGHARDAAPFTLETVHHS